MYRDPILGDATPTTMLKEEKKQETNKFANMIKLRHSKQKKISPKKTPHISRFSKQLIPQGYGIKKENNSIHKPEKVEQKEPLKQIQIIPKSQMQTLKKEQKSNKPQLNKSQQNEQDKYTQDESQQDDYEEFQDDDYENENENENEEYEEEFEDEYDDQDYDEEPEDDDYEIAQSKSKQKSNQKNKQTYQSNSRFKAEQQEVYGRRPKQPMEIENDEDEFQDDYQDDYEQDEGDYYEDDAEEDQDYDSNQYYDYDQNAYSDEYQEEDQDGDNYDYHQNDNNPGQQFEVKKPPFQISKGGLRMVTFELRKNDPTIPRDAAKITERDESGKYITNIKSKLQELRRQAQEKTQQEEILKKQEDKFVPQFTFNQKSNRNSDWTGYAFTDSMATGDDYKQVREHLLRGSDKFETTNGEFDISLFIRPHTRSNQGKDIKELRSYKGIMKCLHRLNEIVVNEEHSYLDVFEYAQDKYRAIKNDLLLVEASNDISHQLIGILELIGTRFYLYSYFKLIKYEWPEEFIDQKTYDRARTNLVEIKKKINSTLSRIVQIYQDLQYDEQDSWVLNFPEFLQYQYLSFLTILPNTNDEIPHVQQLKLYEFIAIINQFKYGKQFYNTQEYQFVSQFQEYSIANNLEKLKNMFSQNINFYQSLFLLLQINQDKYKEINKKNVYIQRGETEEDQDIIRTQSLEKFQQEIQNIYKLIKNTHLTNKQQIDHILNKRGDFKLIYFEDFQNQQTPQNEPIEEGEVVEVEVVEKQPILIKKPSLQIIKQPIKSQKIAKPNNDRFINLIYAYEKQAILKFLSDFRLSKEEDDKMLTEYFIKQRAFRGLLQQFREKKRYNFNQELGQKVSYYCSDSTVTFKIFFYGDIVQLKKISNFLTGGNAFQEFYHQDKQIFIIASLEDKTGVDMYVQVVEESFKLQILDKPSLIVRNRGDQIQQNEVDLGQIIQRESLCYYKPFIDAVRVVLDVAVRQKIPLPQFDLLTFREFCSQIQQAYKLFIEFNDKFETFVRLCIFTEMCFELLAQEHVKMNIIPNEVAKRTIGAEKIIQQLNPNVGLLQKVKGKDILSGLVEYVGDVTQYRHLLQTFPTSKQWIKLWDQLLFDLGSLPITFIISKTFNINLDIQIYEGRVRSQLIFDFDLYDWIQKKVCS